jgi:hypothetical protein
MDTCTEAWPNSQMSSFSLARAVWPATVGVEETFLNVLAVGEFQNQKGGAKFELTHESSEGADIEDHSFHFVDGFKKALVLHTILCLTDDLV